MRVYFFVLNFSGKNFLKLYFYFVFLLKSKSGFLKAVFLWENHLGHLLAHILKNAHGGMVKGDNTSIDGGYMPLYAP